MKTEKIIAAIEKDVENLSVSANDLVAVVTSLLEVLHKNGLDAEAVEALSACGIKYEYEVE